MLSDAQLMLAPLQAKLISCEHAPNQTMMAEKEDCEVTALACATALVHATGTTSLLQADCPMRMYSVDEANI